MPAAIPVITAVIAAGTAVYSADQQRKLQHQAMDQAKAEANKPGVQSAKSPTQKVTSQAQGAMAAASGDGPQGSLAGTLLTGPSGVSNSSLNLGQSTLLGG